MLSFPSTINLDADLDKTAKGKILHVCNTDKFIPGFISFVEAHIGLGGHHFFLIGDHDQYPVKQTRSVEKVPEGALSHLLGYARLALYMHRAEKVMLHGLSKKKIEQLLFFMPWVLKKCYWVIWGSDLYLYKTARHKKGWKKREFFRRPVIKKMGHLVTYVEGDVALARRWYGAEGVYHECLVYPSNLYKEHGLGDRPGGTINIQVGNSSDPANHHAEAFQKVAPYKDENIHLYVPLSYGSDAHAARVEREGERVFGDKITAMRSFMPPADYYRWLESVDIALFNHDRQQAMGNIITLLGMGKTVYLREGVAHKALFDRLGILCLDIDAFSLRLIGEEEKQKNASRVKAFFSRERLIRQLTDIFSTRGS
ncbi:TDP-N-acetylfucosamine:lipid II N-acetylfucosaminyltransferase [Halomonas piscis]|uniref:TDP-N-acetylfucosamine:lipid II N-acetylfucosaminyltransferase n=1 Tax=Halomonas piscis TaxID=3031727 RepID=A0ABY9YZ45_9GAMM|nr:TDP-N-acetylfucosamine:lipid II N-acetylfucosaminyltransferase [Halomonas piscis]WNK20102.1 TDP-N-acetylfucosamine:lipid II N-acetylfucosaminyltransferase [Halomonas piscis]